MIKHAKHAVKQTLSEVKHKLFNQAVLNYAMFVHNLDPVILSLGPIAIRWYSLAYLSGFIIVYWLLKNPEAEKRIKGWKSEYADSYVTWLFFGLLIGARFFHVFVFEFGYYMNHWGQVLQVWKGGLSFHGALVGLFTANYYFAKKYRLQFYDLADFVIVPASLFLVFGRIANFINAEMVGTITNVPWCVKFPNHEGCRHPTVLYEAIKNLFIFSGLLYLRRFRLPRGTLFWTFITAYGLIRFFLMYLRDEAIVFAGLTLSQVFSGLMFIIGSYFLWKRLIK